MILRFQNGEHFVNINTSKECYNYGRTASAYYVSVSEKDYSHILEEMNFNCYDYAESLGLNNPEEFHPFTPNKFNKMCWDCRHLYNLCDGTENEIYSGCIWKEAPAEDLKAYTDSVNKKLKAQGVKT